MNEIKIYLKPSGSLAYLYKDFDLYEGCYRNSQLTVFVPKSLLYENENGTFVNLVKTGAILTAPNGSKLTTKSYYLDYEREQTIGGVDFRVYKTITPKEFCVYAGTQTVVVNVESIDNTNADAQTIISVTTTQTADLIVLESAYLGQDEPIDPTELDKIKATLTEIQSEIGGLPNKYVTVDTNQTISGNKTHTGINVFTGFTSISGIGIDADAIVKGSDRFKYPVKSGTLALTSDIPENIVTTDTDQTIDGTKGFTSPITVGGQTWRTSYMKDSFVYTVDGYSYEVTYPEKSGLMALKSDIPTDYATQGQLAQTNQNVEDLYTILEQAQVVTVTTLEQAYTTRETADGENIVDGVQTTVEEIRGKTVATENLTTYPYSESTLTRNGITFTDNGDGTITVNGTATAQTDFILSASNNPVFATLIAGQSYTLSGCPSGGGEDKYILRYSGSPSGVWNDIGSSRTFSPIDNTTPYNFCIRIAAGYTANNLVFRPMLNEGTEAKPYSKWFAGLKNASFEKIVSTGRNFFGLTADDFKNGMVSGEGEKVILKLLPNTQYTLSTNTPKYSEVAASIWFNGPNSSTDGVWTNQPRTVATDENGNLYIVIRTTEIDTIFNSYWIMLNFGTSALPYEPYTSDTLSADTPIELAEYDVASPETGETKRQSKTIVFDGTEIWNEVSSDTRYQYIYTLPVLAENDVLAVISNLFVTNSENGISLIGETNDGMTSVRVRGNKTEHPDFDTLEKWKAFLAAQSAAGNPLTVTYKTAEATTEATPFNKSKYIAWKNGSETIEQGANDNSEYGAENTVKQDYFTLTGGTTNV